ncbi:MAG: helix-turn-helix transcriptional regulator [Ruminococcaceae bacterium]|nr:helix-turn-helix transcriptional regulator [Oscillospiraceae bacterium]
MQEEFARRLSLLRQEKKLSQRKVAQSLGVSQALLSHYENGVREPGLSFVVNASRFYGVSCDYLLGNAISRDGMGLNPDTIYDVSEQKDNVLRGSVFVMLNKKLLVNSVSMLMEILSKTGSKELANEVCNYLTIAFYKVFRLVYRCDKANNLSEFPVPEDTFSESCDMEMKKSELRLKELAKEDISVPVSMANLPKENSMLAPSLLSILHNASEKLLKKS